MKIIKIRTLNTSPNQITNKGNNRNIKKIIIQCLQDISIIASTKSIIQQKYVLTSRE